MDVRPLHCELDAIPVVHGSALFTRGETQVLATATVGTRADQQRTESLLGGEGSKGLFVNYSFSGLAVNETAGEQWCGGVGQRVCVGWVSGVGGSGGGGVKQGDPAGC